LVIRDLGQGRFRRQRGLRGGRDDVDRGVGEFDGDEIAATHIPISGAVEVARQVLSTPGNPSIDDAHYPPRPAGALARQPKPGNAAEAEFLALGDGARMWLIEAAAAGTSRVKVKMAEAV